MTWHQTFLPEVVLVVVVVAAIVVAVALESILRNQAQSGGQQGLCEEIESLARSAMGILPFGVIRAC
ncbi:MAG: hypothetical protein GDA40_07775 [Rhodobacteraceae bacterium]|nr:hypothetical protein [Paracoccaceae bacterium]